MIVAPLDGFLMWPSYRTGPENGSCGLQIVHRGDQGLLLAHFLPANFADKSIDRPSLQRIDTLRYRHREEDIKSFDPMVRYKREGEENNSVSIFLFNLKNLYQIK